MVKKFYIAALLVFSSHLHADYKSDVTRMLSSCIDVLSQTNKDIDKVLLARAPWLEKSINGLTVSKAVAVTAAVIVAGYIAKKAYNAPCSLGFCRCPYIWLQGKVKCKQCKCN